MGGVVLGEKGRKGALKGGEREKRKGEGGRRRETTKESDGRDGGIDGKEEDIDRREEVGTMGSASHARRWDGGEGEWESSCTCSRMWSKNDTRMDGWA